MQSPHLSEDAAPPQLHQIKSYSLSSPARPETPSYIAAGPLDEIVVSTQQSARGPPDEATLRSLRQLRSLFLCNRGLRSLSHIRHLNHMTGLRSLNVHMNCIQRVHMVPPLRQLQELDLSANEITQLEPDCFQSLRCLRRLNLSSNLLTSIPSGVLAPLKALEWLSIGFNELQSLAGLQSLPTAAPLAYVDLCGNRIQRVEDVEAALAAHRDHIEELRLEAPSLACSAIPTPHGTSASVRITPPIAVSRAMATRLALRENPFCYTATAQEGAAITSSGHGGQRRSYVDRVLDFFPRLMVLNGVAVGVDPVSLTQLSAGNPTAAVNAVHTKQHSTLSSAADEGRSTIKLPALPPRYRAATPAKPSLRSSTLPRARTLSSTVVDQWPRESHGSLRRASSSPLADRKPRHREQTRKKSQDHAPPLQPHERHTPAADQHAGEVLPASHPVADAALVTAAPPRMEGVTEKKTDPASVRWASENGAPPEVHTPPQTQRDEKEHAKVRTLSQDRSPNGLTPAYEAVSQRKTLDVGALSADTSYSSSSSTIDGRVAVSSSLRWCPRRVSRGTSTAADLQPPALVEQGSQTVVGDDRAEVEVLQLRLQQLHEQLVLRVGLEDDLRRHLDAFQQRYLELDAAKTSERRLLRSQVSALKDELARRSQEISIVHRKASADAETRIRTVTAQLLEVVREKEQRLLQLEESHGRLRERTMRELTVLHEEKNTLQHDGAVMRHEMHVREAERGQLMNELQSLTQQWHSCVAAWEAERGLYVLQIEEQVARREVELDALGELRSLTSAPDNARPTSFLAGVFALQHQAHERLLHECARHQHRWEEYCRALQAQCEEALVHASREVQRLTAETAAARADGGSRRRTSDAGCDPVELPSVTAESDVVQHIVRVDVATQTAAESPKSPRSASDGNQPQVLEPPAVEHGPSTSLLDTYWREACQRQMEESVRLQRAFDVSQETQGLVMSENHRLLQQVDELQRLLTAQTTQAGEAAKAAARERENLLRTVHNLEASLEKKDAALDSLEEEAREKLTQKRAQIAELEGQVESLQEAQERTTAQSIRYRDAVEERERKLEEVSAELQDEREGRALLEKQEASRVPQLERQVQELADALAAIRARETLGGDDRSHLLGALQLARDQLARVHASHATLLREKQAAVVALAQRDAQIAELRQQLCNTQELNQAKQRATLEALSHMMLADSAVHKYPATTRSLKELEKM